MTLELISEAVRNGARLEKACETLGISERTVQRWRRGPGEDGRCGPKTTPANKLSKAERQRIVDVATSPEFRDQSPKQIVPKLADRGEYVASESSFYRTLREENLQHHRERSSAPTPRPPRRHRATGPNQVWSWDITYLRTMVRGVFFYLYMSVDIWSRKIVAWDIHECQSDDLAAELLEHGCNELGVEPSELVYHADNGGPMKGATMLATMQRLGVMPSFSRPGVSDDNPFIESLFRTLKYRPKYPSRPFASLDEAKAWVADFVRWYNTQHLHSGIRFVTPDDRHFGREDAVLARRREVYERARRAHPERWSGDVRNWKPISVVELNPELERAVQQEVRLAA